jgi:hypothetical protein
MLFVDIYTQQITKWLTIFRAENPLNPLTLFDLKAQPYQ